MQLSRQAPHRRGDDVPWWRLALVVWLGLGIMAWLLSGCQKPAADAPAAAPDAARPSTPAMGAGPQMRPVTRPAVRRPATHPRPRPPVARRAAPGLAPLSKDVDVGPEVKRLFDTLFCVGRPADKPCQQMAAAIERYRRTYRAPMRKWLQTKRPAKLPPTLLYPFAGGDLVSAVSAFPHQRRYVHLSLEHAGPPDPLRGLKPFQITDARWKLHYMAGLLLAHGESFSVDLQKQEQARLPGVLPLFLVGLRVHGGTPTGLAYVRVTPEGKLVPYTRAELSAAGPKARRLFATWKDPRYSKRFAHLELRFRLPGDKTDRRVIHLAANLGNPGMKRAPGVGRLLASLKPRSLMIKASSYLMWTDDFSRVRDLIFTDTRFALSDLTAPYPAWLQKRGYQVETYGKFACITKPRLAGSALPWVQAFRKPTSPDLPFRYGYHDCRKQNHLVIIRKK